MCGNTCLLRSNYQIYGFSNKPLGITNKYSDVMGVRTALAVVAWRHLHFMYPLVN